MLTLESLIELKKLRPPPAEKGNAANTLFWCYDYVSESPNVSRLQNQSISLLEDLASSENVDLLPDPTVNVIGVWFDKDIYETAMATTERSLSPSSVSKSKAYREEDTDRDIVTPRTANTGYHHHNGNDTSQDISTVRDKISSYSKEKNKSTLASITNKYTKLKAKAPSFRTETASGSKGVTTTATAVSSTAANQNKFNLNLSAVKRVSTAGKATQPTSGRDYRDAINDSLGTSGTLYSERRRGINTPTMAASKIASKTARYGVEKRHLGTSAITSTKGGDDSVREDSLHLGGSQVKRRQDLASTLASRLKK